jgi:photosystem II stability/assembly factor-like uncharacterized protein
MIARLFLLLLLIGIPALVFAQKLIPPPAPLPGEAPPWVALLLGPDPDVPALDEAVQRWQASHPSGKTTWLQYYRKWRRSVEPWLTPQGRILPPDNSQLAARPPFRESAPGRSDAAEWTCLGPYETVNDAVDGPQLQVSWQANVYCLDQSLSHPDILYCGTEGAEIFRSADRGLSWQPASRTLACEAITALAVHPTDPQQVWAGDRHRIYHTSDGGTTWTVLLTESQLQINDIALHPLNPQIVLAAGGKGLWRSTDGGGQWTRGITEACYDIEFRPGSPDVVYLLRDDPADKRCTFWKSVDAGQSFSLKNQGWFDGQDPGRSNGGARMTVTPADPDRIYVVLIGQAKAGDNGFIGVYRSQDSGESWTLPNPPAGGPYSAAHPNLAVINPFQGTGFHQGFYNLSIAASHTDPDQLLVGHLSLWRSTDGGAGFQLLGGYGGSLSWIHPDIQEIRVNGTDTWVCTDGGINHSQDFFQSHQSRKQGITSSDFWGFSQGWNEDILAGGRYHNGNTGWYETYTPGRHLRLGGAEAPTGYVRPGPGRQVYFSDIGGKILPLQEDLPSRSFSVSRWPNELYFAAESSEQVWAPDCYNHYFLGQENSLWKTEDGGNAFELLHTFSQTNGGRITQIAVCREDPRVIYLAQRNTATWSEGWVWRSGDAGSTWESLPLPTGYKRRFLLSVHPLDPNHLWLGYTDGENGRKVFESTDGGQTWSNITTALLDGESPQSLVHLAGTPGSLLLGTSRGVFYRAGPDGEWEPFHLGLPAAISVNLLRPFYRDSKVRLGAYGKGIWESPLPEGFEPLVQPTVDKRLAWCPRDTFYFDDHSVADHQGLSWHWSFPGGSPAEAGIRDPRVIYPQAGMYQATLTLNGPFGSLSRSLEVEVRDECSPDSLAGLALRLQDNGDAAVVRDGDNLVHQELTFSAWVKPEGTQSSYAGIIIGTYAGNAYGLNVRDDNRLGYHWPGGAWWWDSGFTLREGEWQHVALVVQPGSVTVYHDGVGKTHNTGAQPVALDALHIGRYRDWNERTFRGWIDEVCIWSRALSRGEIREGMHLTREPARDTGILAYYQFNRMAGAETDRIGMRHLSFAGGAHRVASTAPAGAGSSARLLPVAGTELDFAGTGISLAFASGSDPEGEIVISRIRVQPDVIPDEGNAAGPMWWVCNHYGQATLPPLESLHVTMAGPVWPENEKDPSTLTLFRREWNGEGDTWSEQARAVQAEAGPEGSIRFAEGNAPGQWILSNAAEPVTAVEGPSAQIYPESQAVLYPNPVPESRRVYLRTTLEGPLHWRLLDGSGRLHRQGPLRVGDSIGLEALPAGWYYYEVRSATHMVRGALLIP